MKNYNAKVYFTIAQKIKHFPKNYLKKIIQLISNKQKKPISISIKFVNIDEMLFLNTMYRNIKKSTNVLAFPFYNTINSKPSKNFIGDLAICYNTVVQESIQQKKTILSHLSHIIIHGTLHLLGFDHVDYHSKKKMESLEIDILSSIGYNNPYIYY